MKKILFLLGMSLLFSSCRDDENTSDNSQPFREAATPTIEHVSIPLTDTQLLELFQGMSPVLPETRVAVFEFKTKEEIEFWSTAGPGVLVVYFGATWSGPSKIYHPVFVAVADQYTNSECHFGRVDVDEVGEYLLAAYDIDEVPITLIIKNMKIVARVTGPINKNLLTQLVNNYI